MSHASLLDLPWCLDFLTRHGKQKFGAHFHIREADHHIIYKLLVYFLRLESEATPLGIDLNKGILLTGPVGCGKTALMSLMSFIPGPDRNYVMRPCRDISFELFEDGYQVINRYSKLSYNGHSAKIYCFDDLGAEQTLKYFGNQCNVMAEILLSRYDLFVTHKMITHVTTNLSATELEAMYGNRVRSRMREMLNLFAFPEDASDKRQ